MMSRGASRHPDILTTKELGHRLGLSEKTIRRMAAAGQLPAMRTGKDYRYSWQAIIATLRQFQPAEPLADSARGAGPAALSQALNEAEDHIGHYEQLAADQLRVMIELRAAVDDMIRAIMDHDGPYLPVIDQLSRHVDSADGILHTSGLPTSVEPDLDIWHTVTIEEGAKFLGEFFRAAAKAQVHVQAEHLLHSAFTPSDDDTPSDTPSDDTPGGDASAAAQTNIHTDQDEETPAETSRKD